MAWISINFESKALGMPVMTNVLMPQGRGGYKTLYLLHGAGGDYASWLLKSRVTDYAEGKNIAVVMPSGNNKCYVNNRYGKDYFTFLTEELIEKCETWFDLSPKKEDRFIAGMSMGGYGAVHAALKRPELYGKAFSYSGLLDISERFLRPQGLDLKPVFGEKEDFSTVAADLFELTHKTGINLSGNVDNLPEIFITCGLQDKRIEMSRKLYEAMKQENFNVHYITETGGHDWTYWDACIQNTIQILNDKVPVSPDWRSICR